MIELTQKSIQHWLPLREPDAHKGDFGRLLMIAGSRGMMGACVLACRAAFRSGAGLVAACCDPSLFSDVHAGAGCTIGTTMTITDKVVPNMVGVDIGCGMETVKLKDDLMAKYSCSIRNPFTPFSA